MGTAGGGEGEGGGGDGGLHTVLATGRQSFRSAAYCHDACHDELGEMPPDQKTLHHVPGVVWPPTMLVGPHEQHLRAQRGTTRLIG